MSCIAFLLTEKHAEAVESQNTCVSCRTSSSPVCGKAAAWTFALPKKSELQEMIQAGIGCGYARAMLPSALMLSHAGCCTRDVHNRTLLAHCAGQDIPRAAERLPDQI